MAETSGFLTDLPQSAYLASSMRRAISAAQQRSHRYVTLEHLLLALLDDPDAIAILEAVRADIPAIRASITDTVNRNLATLYTPGQFDLRASYKVERVLQTASDDASRLGCHEVDAAFVLSALARESDNPAADILKRNGFSYPSAMTWLYANRGSSPSSRASAASRSSSLNRPRRPKPLRPRLNRPRPASWSRVPRPTPRPRRRSRRPRTMRRPTSWTSKSSRIRSRSRCQKSCGRGRPRRCSAAPRNPRLAPAARRRSRLRPASSLRRSIRRMSRRTRRPTPGR